MKATLRYSCGILDAPQVPVPPTKFATVETLLRVLLLSNLYPMVGRPFAAPFITARIDAHQVIGNSITAVALGFAYRGVSKKLLYRRYGDTTPAPGSQFTEASTPIGLSALLKLRSKAPDTRLIDAVADRLSYLPFDQYDVIHAHGMYNPPAGVVAKRVGERTGLPYVVTVHGSDVNSLLPARIESYREVFNRAQKTIAVSSALGDKLQTCGVSKQNISVVPNGVDIERFRPASGEFFRADNTKKVLYVGNLLPVKGADRLPSIFAEIQSRSRNISFQVVGTGPLEKSLRARTERLPIEFLGAIPQYNVAQVVREAAVVVLPSRNEGWPSVVLEAHASGVPIVVSDAGGAPEAVGSNEFVVEDGPLFAERFGKRVVRVLSSERNSTALRKRAERYSWQAIAEQETKLYA